MARRVGFGDAPRDERAKRLIQEDQPGWEAYLDDGERLLWTGQPEPGMSFTLSDIFKSLFGLFFLAFALFWVGAASQAVVEAGPVGLVFPLFGTPFIFVGCYLLFGRYFWEAHVRKHTRYALTDRCALVATSVRHRKMKSWPITDASEIELLLGPPDTVNFASRRTSPRNGNRKIAIGFERIVDGAHVYKLLRDIKSSGPHERY